MQQGYFKQLVIDVAKIINENFTLNSVIEVKHLRKAMNISSKNRSKILFLSKALQRLSDLGHLEYLGKNSPKKFRKLKKIDLDVLKDLQV
ncbi:MAG: hypothetical protein ACTSYS_03890 [Promethearchaeota archaeon]